MQQRLDVPQLGVLAKKTGLSVRQTGEGRKGSEDRKGRGWLVVREILHSDGVPTKVLERVPTTLHRSPSYE